MKAVSYIVVLSYNGPYITSLYVTGNIVRVELKSFTLNKFRAILSDGFIHNGEFWTHVNTDAVF